MTWRFAAAPATLKSLHCQPETPEWLVLVPRALSGTDLHEAIMQGSKHVARYDTPDGDAVYIGTSPSDPPARPSSIRQAIVGQTIVGKTVMAATCSRPK
jgi:hypothetical protein